MACLTRSALAPAATIVLAASPDPRPERPQHTGDSQLVRPGDCRAWFFLIRARNKLRRARRG
jgi:hypothetical protein